jgi:hypothetical protein
MLQAVVCDGGKLDAFAFGEDRIGSTEVEVGGRQVINALMVAKVIVVLDKGLDLPSEAVARPIGTSHPFAFFDKLFR